jgi:hypothetical protein
VRTPSLLKTTTFRLALVNILLFVAFSLALLAFLYVSTVGYIKSEAARQVEAELASLANAYRNGGFDRLNQSVAERASAPGPYAYFLQGADGRKISGDFDALPMEPPLPGVIGEVVFDYSLLRPDGSLVTREAEGRGVRLANGEVLFVSFDWDERTEVVNRITAALIYAVPIGLVLSLIGGLVISRSASRRADALVRTTEGVMGGDLSRRAPTNDSGDEFDRLSVRMNAMLAWLETLVNSTRDTGNAIAHDLRSPLTRLRNRIEGALSDRQLDEEKARETLSTALEEVDRVLNTFNGILRLSRLGAGSGGALNRLDASALANEMAELFAPVCEEDNIAFDTDIAAGLQVLGDRELLGQALANLLDNAVKYVGQPGRISVRVRRRGSEQVELSVCDNGPGIPAADRKRAVERFVRLESSRSEPGSGLGLALVEAIANHHHGVLELSDAGGPAQAPGLCATLILPRAR